MRGGCDLGKSCLEGVRVFGNGFSYLPNHSLNRQRDGVNESTASISRTFPCGFLSTSLRYILSNANLGMSFCKE